MRHQLIMNTVHLSLFPSTWKRAYTHTHKKRSTGEHAGFGEYEEVECDSAVEGSEMKTGKAARGGGLFFQRTEGVLHVLHKLNEVGLDLSLAILQRVLCRQRNTILQTWTEDRRPNLIWLCTWFVVLELWPSFSRGCIDSKNSKQNQICWSTGDKYIHPDILIDSTHTHTHLEFHWAHPVEDFSHVLLDHGPSDLVVTLSRGLHCVSCHVVERNHVRENANRLVEGTEPEKKSWINNQWICSFF